MAYPQLILAGSSIDDIIMIVFYQAFLSIEGGGTIGTMTFFNIGIAIGSGILVGIGIGFLIALFFKKLNLTSTMQIISLLAIGIGLTALEIYLNQWFLFSSLLSIITMCLIVRIQNKPTAIQLTKSISHVWVPAEMFLFFLVGASIQMEFAFKYFLPALAILSISLLAQSLMVSGCLIKTKLNAKERLFTILSYLPKATVQASIGGGLLDLGNQIASEIIILAGTIVLSVSVLSILITAPISALTMNLSYQKLLPNDSNDSKSIS